jgi:hypothetical protein
MHVTTDWPLLDEADLDHLAGDRLVRSASSLTYARSCSLARVTGRASM